MRVLEITTQVFGQVDDFSEYWRLGFEQYSDCCHSKYVAGVVLCSELYSAMKIFIKVLSLVLNPSHDCAKLL